LINERKRKTKEIIIYEATAAAEERR